MISRRGSRPPAGTSNFSRLIVHWLCRRYFRSTIKINVHLFIPTIGIFAFQMSIDIIISKRRELTIGTIGTFECPLVAKWSPFILTHWLVASFPTCLAVPPTGKHVFTPFEKASNSLMRPSSRSRSIYHSWCCTLFLLPVFVRKRLSCRWDSK